MQDIYGTPHSIVPQLIHCFAKLQKLFICLCLSADNTSCGSHERLGKVRTTIRRRVQRLIGCNPLPLEILQAIPCNMSAHSSDADTCLSPSPSPSPKPRPFSELLLALFKAAEDLTGRLDDNIYQALSDIDNKTKLTTRASLEFALH